MPHGNPKRVGVLSWWQNRQNRQIPGILRVYLEKPGIPGNTCTFACRFRPRDHTHSRYTNRKPRIPLSHTTIPYHSKTNQNITKYRSHTGKYSTLGLNPATTRHDRHRDAARFIARCVWLPVDAGGFYGARRGVRILYCERER